MSAQKMREVTRQVQGLGALEAMAVLQIVPRKGARLVSKVLRSAIANAENNKNLKPETLRVKEAVARESMRLAATKLPIKTKFVSRHSHAH